MQGVGRIDNSVPKLLPRNPNPSDRDLVLDVSRLIWRVWTGRLATGIDKVCLAYLSHFGPSALAMIQYGRLRMVFDAPASDRLFALLAAGGPKFRQSFVSWSMGALIHRYRGGLSGKIYLNVGHTGLNASGLVTWLQASGMRPVFLIHDLIPITHPQFCRPGESQHHTRRIRHALACADGIIVNSQDTLDKLAGFAAAHGYRLDKTTVAWLGIDHVAPSPAETIASERPNFLVVGTIEARKNHILLLRIWERLFKRFGEELPRLIVVGQRGWEAEDAIALLDQAKNIHGGVQELGKCSDATLAELTRHTRALLMPSYAEGFGLPVLEALQLGVPVIASDLAVFRELAGSIPLYLDPEAEPAWEAAIVDFFSDSDERERQLRAITTFPAPSWNQHFANIESFLAELP